MAEQKTITITTEITVKKKYTMEVPADLDINSEEGEDFVNELFWEGKCKEIEDAYWESDENVIEREVIKVD